MKNYFLLFSSHKSGEEKRIVFRDEGVSIEDDDKNDDDDDNTLNE